MKKILLSLLLLTSIIGKSQSSYSGNLRGNPITLIMYHYSDGDSRAYYTYDKFDTPITINGNLKNGDLTLFEKDNLGKNYATLIFKNFKESNNTINGKWVSSDKSKTYQISLKKDFSIGTKNSVGWKSKELIQPNSTKEHYFKTIITKDRDQLYVSVSAVKIFQKKTDKLLQTINLDCNFLRMGNVNVGDYNFDGVDDFSVFESSYSGPNTTSIYILRNSDSEKYQVSNFSGISLEFDNDSKLIYEHNQCCAGTSQTNTTYKVINNEMVLIEKKCIQYDEKEEDYIETDCK